MKYVLVDIGCIECGEETNVIGIFTDKIAAEKLVPTLEKQQAKHWSGEHHFEIFEVAEDNVVNNPYADGEI